MNIGLLILVAIPSLGLMLLIIDRLGYAWKLADKNKKIYDPHRWVRESAPPPPKQKESKLNLIPHKDHLPPNYHGYNGGYANVNKCISCKLTGLHEDMHTVNPCPRCGSKVIRHNPSRWSNRAGIPPMWITNEDAVKIYSDG